jgi:RNA polymerase primary sigma factor
MMRMGPSTSMLTALGQRMVEENQGLAYAVAQRSWPGPLDRDERISVALEALVRAVQSFNPGLGFRFSTYAVKAIHHELQRAILLERLIPVRAEALSSRASAGRRQKAKKAGVVYSFDAIEGFDPAARPDRAEPSWQVEWVRRSVDRLPDRLRRVMRWRLEGRTLEAIGSILGLSRARVGQLEEIARRKIRRDLLSTGKEALSWS